MTKLLKPILVLSLSLLSVTASIASPIADIYQIEVIVFEHNDPNRFKVENWPKFVTKLDVTKAVNLNSLPTGIPESLDTLETLDALDNAGEEPVKKITAQTITLVEPQNYLLKNELKRLRASADERFIKHIAWNQPLANNVKSTPVYFSGGNEQEITSLITIKPNRNIFNVNINMIYKIQPEDLRYDPGVEEIKIARDVRIKKKEVFYVDHPVIGVMLIISPVIYSASGSYQP